MIERVVIVDDDRPAVQIFARGVPPNVSLLVAADDEEALALCKKHRPDLAVVDLRSSADHRLSHLPLLRRASPKAQIVVTSVYASIELAVRAMRAGADDVIFKPTSFGELVRRMGQDDPLDLAVPSLARVQWEHVQRVFAACGGNMSLTARQLGVYRTTLRRWLSKLAPRT